MIALAITAVLITQTWGGEMHVTEGLSDHACLEAKCVAESGLSCDGRDARDAELEKRRGAAAQWLRLHPEALGQCKAAQAKGTVNSIYKSCAFLISASPNWRVRAIEPGDIKTAICAK